MSEGCGLLHGCFIFKKSKNQKKNYFSLFLCWVTVVEVLLTEIYSLHIESNTRPRKINKVLHWLYLEDCFRTHVPSYLRRYFFFVHLVILVKLSCFSFNFTQKIFILFLFFLNYIITSRWSSGFKILIPRDIPRFD